jgi:hypothetical protein
MERNELQTELQTTADQASKAYVAGNIVLGDVLLARCRALQARLEAAPAVAQSAAVAPSVALPEAPEAESAPDAAPDFNTALAAWLKRAQEIVGPNATVEINRIGPKYVRIATIHGTGRSVLVFIVRETGDILKPASWKAPEKNFARGNIFDPSKPGMARYGALTLR